MRATTYALALVALLGLPVGCGDSDGDDDGNDTTTPDAGGPDAGGAAATLTFSVSNGVRQNPGLVDPLEGAIYGQIFLSSDVTLTGPVDGAEAFGSVEVSGIDLVAAPTSGSWTSPLLPDGNYTFLGFFDVDGNGADSRDPDSGDPVTLPISNKFDIVAGEPAMVTVVFDLVFN